MSDITLDFTVNNNQANFTVTPNDLTVTVQPTNLTFYNGGYAQGVGPAGAVQFVGSDGGIAGNSTFTFDTTNGLLSVPAIQLSNAAYLPDVSNVRILGGTNGYVLQTDGIGNLSWTAQSGGGGNGSPGGANTQIQYNNSGNFGGNALFTFNSVTGNVNIPGNINVTGNIIGYVANSNRSNYSNIANIANTASSVPGGNVTGQVANALIAGTVYTNAQPNITSVGNLVNLNVQGNVTANGTVAGNQLISTVSGGLPPLVVNSSVVVPNLRVGLANISSYVNVQGTVLFGDTNLPYISGHDGQNAQFSGSNILITGSNYDSVKAVSITTTANTYANLPSGSSRFTGTRAIITNANTTTFNSLVSGGGSNVMPVFYDGTNWRVG
jgi:hypothetical protein